jgi:hypothetical protein
MLDDAWWERVDLNIKIMDPIISLSQFVDMDKPILGEVYEGWDSMNESMRTIILQNESPEYGTPPEIFFTIVEDILINRWDKNCTPLHCLANSLNPNPNTTTVSSLAVGLHANSLLAWIVSFHMGERKHLDGYIRIEQSLDEVEGELRRVFHWNWEIC